VPTVFLLFFSPKGLSQPLIANIHGLKEVKEGGEVDMEVTWNVEEKNQQDRLLGVNRELGTLRRDG
jgi:hypothetical protein